MDAISPGAIISALSTGTPSTTYRGSAPSPNVDVPRTFITAPSPGAPELVTICTPAT